MDTNILKILQDAGLDSEKIEEVMAAMQTGRKASPQEKKFDVENLEGQINAVRLAMNQETDYRKKAALAAKIMSIELDDDFGF